MFTFEHRIGFEQMYVILTKLSMCYSRMECLRKVDWSLLTWIWGFHSTGYEKRYFLGYNLASLSKSLLSTYVVLVSCSVDSLTIKIKAKCSSETSTGFQPTIPGYIAEYIPPGRYLYATMGTSNMNGVQWLSYFCVDSLIKNVQFTGLNSCSEQAAAIGI
jgi:hypothetical protein